MDLPKDLLTELEVRGWFPERRIALPDDPLRHPAAQEFLENFGDIVVSRTNLDQLLGKIPSTGKSFVDWFDFCYERAARRGNLSAQKLDNLAKIIGKPLYIIGEADCGHTTLLIDETKRFFGHSDGYCGHLANSTQQLLYNLWNSPYYDRTDLLEINLP